MRAVTAGRIAEAVGGRLISGDPETKITGIAFDSRQVQPGDIFVPIIGEKVDGHRFIDDVFARGAAAVFTSEHEEAFTDKACIRVDDTLEALQQVGALCRSGLSYPLIGITGSVGKTTTRMMVQAALSAGLRTEGTKGNNNGQIGLPVTLSRMDPDAQIGVVEMGMSLPGEMARISRIARVDAAIVTMIGVSHIENLGSQERIFEEKIHIADGFGPENKLIFNGDDPILRSHAADMPCPVILYGTGEDCAYRAEDIRMEEGTASFTAVTPKGEYPISLHLPGLHNVGNALAGLAAADLFGVELSAAAAALERVEAAAGRLRIRRTKNDIVIIDDAYNASPESMHSAFQVLAGLQGRSRKAALLADMLEMGEDAPLFHERVGREAAGAAEEFFLVGPLADNYRRVLEEAGKKTRYYLDRKEAFRDLADWLQPGDALLIKGSNGMKLFELNPVLEEKFGFAGEETGEKPGGKTGKTGDAPVGKSGNTPGGMPGEGKESGTA